MPATVGGYSEYSLCQGISGLCSERGQSGSSDVEGAIAVDGNFQGDLFYIGLYLSNSVVLAVDNNVSGTLDIQGGGNVGVYGGTNTAVLPPAVCTPNCAVPNLVQNNSLLPDFATINSDLTSQSTSWTSTATTGGTRRVGAGHPDIDRQRQYERLRRDCQPDR